MDHDGFDGLNEIIAVKLHDYSWVKECTHYVGKLRHEIYFTYTYNYEPLELRH